MHHNDITEKLYNIMLADAGEGFQATEQYRLLEEKLKQMDRDCWGMFDERERQFADECFALLGEVSRQRESHLYRRGMLDCVHMLKALKVLA